MKAGKIIYRDPKTLHQHPHNPRKISKEDFARLVDSIRTNGFWEHRPEALEEVDGKLLILCGNQRNKAAIKLPLRDGDVERDDEAYKGHWFINANSNTAPQIVDRTVKPILDRSEVYSGCYARVSLNFYAFNSNGNKGVACGLGNIQKVRDGEPLGGRTNAADDFATLDDDDFLA